MYGIDNKRNCCVWGRQQLQAEEPMRCSEGSSHGWVHHCGTLGHGSAAVGDLALRHTATQTQLQSGVRLAAIAATQKQ